MSLRAAENDLARQAGLMAREHPDSDADWIFSVSRLRDYLYGAARPALLALLAASGILLLIACVNVASFRRKIQENRLLRARPRICAHSLQRVTEPRPRGSGSFAQFCAKK